VLEGLFCSGAVVVEGDRDARFYQTLSNRMQPEIDLHFVNAGSKHTVSRILGVYKKMGVRCAGIVDFDVLNDKMEFELQLKSVGLEKEAFSAASEKRETIAASVEKTSPDGRWADVTKKIEELGKLSAIAFEGDKDNALTQIERNCQEIAAATKLWNAVKRRGCGALSDEAIAAFRELYECCSREGLFINPKGELESLLSDYDIHHSTNKKNWFNQALEFVSQLEVDDEKQPWKLIGEVHGFLSHG